MEISWLYIIMRYLDLWSSSVRWLLCRRGRSAADWIGLVEPGRPRGPTERADHTSGECYTPRSVDATMCARPITCRVLILDAQA